MQKDAFSPVFCYVLNCVLQQLAPRFAAVSLVFETLSPVFLQKNRKAICCKLPIFSVETAIYCKKIHFFGIQEYSSFDGEKPQRELNIWQRVGSC